MTDVTGRDPGAIIVGESGREWVLGPRLSYACRDDSCEVPDDADGCRHVDGWQEHYHCGNCNAPGVSKHFGHWRGEGFTCA